MSSIKSITSPVADYFESFFRWFFERGGYGCGGPPPVTKRDAGPEIPDGGNFDAGDGGSVDGGYADGGEDGGFDGGLPVRPGITERWTQLDNCNLKDLVLADHQLQLLCEGIQPDSNRIVGCPVSDSLEQITCDNSFFPLSLRADDKQPISFTPLSLQNIDVNYAAVTAKTSDNHPGFAVIDRVRRAVTDFAFFSSRTLQIGSDQFHDDFFASPMMGLALFNGSLAVPARFATTRNGTPLGEHGAVFLYPWNGNNGTFERNSTGIGPQMLVSSNPNPTLFFGENADSARVVNNGEGANGAGLDFLHLITNTDGTTRFELDRSQNIALGQYVLEPLTHAGISPDQRTILLAAGATLLAVTPASVSNAVCSYKLDAEKITATQWYRDGTTDKLFVSTPYEIFRLTLRNGCPVGPVSGVPVFGEATVSAIDNSNLIFYQGLRLLNGQDAITALSFEVF
ncbi:MAG: hypothetical protein HY877_01350 [Deltaproteobacteria bacterium]|nr:hypothetical protein [Deltaproteobacteria bacterium]